MPGEVLDVLATGYAPLAGGYQPQYRYGMEGVPFVGTHPLVGMLAQPMLMNMMGGVGMTPFGLGHDQNIADVMRHRQFMAEQRQAMANVSGLERANMMRTMRGLAALSGVSYGAEQRRMARSAVDTLSYATPVLAQMYPDFLEQLGGMRGSPTVMMNRMMTAGRYQLDPVSGRMGIDPESMSRTAETLYQDLYSSRAGMNQAQGFGAGQIGGLYAGLVQRGLVSRAPGTLAERTQQALGGLSATQVEQAAANRQVTIPAGGVSRLTAADLDKLALNDDVAMRLRSFDADRIKRAITSYGSAVAAVRDIFGDAGRPNAPMSQLLQSLDALTAGQVGQIDPNRAGQMVRQTANLARATGVSLDNALVVQQHAASRAAQLGLEPAFAVQATQGGLAFGGAYRGMGLAAHTAWGAMNADQLQQADVNLRVGAAASNTAQRLAVVRRLAAMHGGFEEGSTAANLAAAVGAGLPQYQDADGQTRQIGQLNTREFYRVLSTARGRGGANLGISESDVREMLTHASANREVIERDDLGGLVRGLQGPHQVQPFLADRLRETVAARLTQAGVSRGSAAASAEEISRRATERIMGLSTRDFANEARRTERMADILGEELGGTEAGGVLEKMAPAERTAFLRMTASRFYGRADEAIARSGFRGLGNLQNVQRLFDPRVLAEAGRQQQAAAFEGQIQEVMSPLGRGSALQRVVQGLQDARPGAVANEVISEALGGVRTEDIGRRLAGPAQGLAGRITAIQNLQKDILRAAPGSPARRDLEKKLQGLLGDAREQAARFAKLGHDFGLFEEGGVSAKETGPAIDLTRAVAGQVVDVTGLSGGFGLDVSADALKAAKERYAEYQADPREVAAILIARRREQAGNIPEERLKAYTEAVKREAPFLSDDEAREQARRRVIAWQLDPKNLHKISAAELDQEKRRGRSLTDEEARAYVLASRQLTPLRPDKAKVAKALESLRAADPKATEDEAYQLATSRLRAERSGIGQEEVDRARAAGAAAGRPLSEQEGIAAVMAGREQFQFQVTPEQIEYARQANPATFRGLSDDQARARILRERDDHRSQRFRDYWTSEDGARLRENVQRQGETLEDVSEKLLGESSVRRFGTQAVEMSNRLRDIAQRRRILAFRYTGGDVAALVAGDYRGITDPREYAQLRRELAGLHGGEQDVYRRLHATHGKAGHQYRLGGTAEQPLEERERLGNVEEAAQLLMISPEKAKGLLAADPKSLSMVDTVLRNVLEARAGQVGLARRLTGGDEEAVARYGEDRDDLEQLARRHNVSVADLLKSAGGQGGPGPSLLTPAERKRRDAQLAAYGAAKSAGRVAGTDAERIARQLKGVDTQLNQAGLGGAERDDLEKRRVQLVARQDAAKARQQEAAKQTAAAEAAVAADARTHGVSAEDYLEGKGFISDAERTRIIAAAAKSGKSLEEIRELAKRLKVSPEDLPAVMKQVVEPQLALAAEHKRRAAETGMEVLGDLTKGFGLDRPRREDARAAELAQKIGASPEARGWAQYLVQSQQRITAAGKEPGLQGAGTAGLVRRWRDAMASDSFEGRDQALKQLQTDLGIDVGTDRGRMRWNQLTEALDIHKRAGLLEEGEGDRPSLERLGRAFDRLQKGGELRPPAAGGGGGWPSSMTITGRLAIDGRVGDLNAKTGGVPSNAAAP